MPSSIHKLSKQLEDSVKPLCPLYTCLKSLEALRKFTTLENWVKQVSKLVTLLIPFYPHFINIFNTQGLSNVVPVDLRTTVNNYHSKMWMSSNKTHILLLIIIIIIIIIMLGKLICTLRKKKILSFNTKCSFYPKYNSL